VNLLECIHVVSPGAIERARRLEAAIALLRQGIDRREVSGTIRRKYSVNQATAWRIVEMAIDVSGVLPGRK
jgi:hypothetical protein